MRSAAKGDGQVFWQEQGVTPAFFRDRSKRFEVLHDGAPHQYSIQWSVENPLLAVRIDPATAKGQITLSDIRLTTGKEIVPLLSD